MAAAGRPCSRPPAAEAAGGRPWPRAPPVAAAASTVQPLPPQSGCQVRRPSPGPVPELLVKVRARGNIRRRRHVCDQRVQRTVRQQVQRYPRRHVALKRVAVAPRLKLHIRGKRDLPPPVGHDEIVRGVRDGWPACVHVAALQLGVDAHALCPWMGPCAVGWGRPHTDGSSQCPCAVVSLRVERVERRAERVERVQPRRTKWA